MTKVIRSILVITTGLVLIIVLLWLIQNRRRQDEVGTSLSEYNDYRVEWESARIPDYQFTINNNGFSNLSMICPIAKLTIRKNKVVTIENPDTNRSWIGYEDQCLAIYEKLTIEGVFELAAQYLHLSRDQPFVNVDIRIRYHKEYAFIEQLKVIATYTFFRFDDSTVNAYIPASFEIDIENFERAQ